jgi:hypothetical protein
MYSMECGNPLFGTTTNPHNSSREAGGSSGGQSLRLRHCEFDPNPIFSFHASEKASSKQVNLCADDADSCRPFNPMSCVFQNIDPPPSSPPGECVVCTPAFGAGGRTHSLGGEGWGGGGQYFGRRRHSSVLYICKYFVRQGKEGFYRHIKIIN